VEVPTVFGRGWALLVLLAYPFVAGAMHRRGRASPRRLILLGLLVLYAASVVAATLLPLYVVPDSWRDTERWWDVIRLVPLMVPPIGNALNIVMFVPLGVLVPLLWPALGTVRRMAWCGLAASAAIEFTQLGMWLAVGNRRFFDVNDLMSNTAGAVLGLLLLLVLRPEPAGEQAPAAAARR
jgi:glycopeptide antibiotics resistance protein